jgi:Uma2 family endonuclease
VSHPADSPPFTKADWDRLPEGFPAQLIDGWLVKEPTPTYDHQRFTSRIWGRLQALVGPDQAVHAPLDVVLDDRNVYQPDVVVLREAPVPGAARPSPPLLVVEVLSPATAQRDRTVKRERLLAAGTGEVWLVDPMRRSIERYDLEGKLEVHGDTTLASRVLPGFTLAATELFGPPHFGPAHLGPGSA